MKKRLAIIPARSGSRRIKNKNIKKFINKPIILRVLDEISKTNLFQEIYVSTDSLKIASIVKKHNYKIDFLRPKYLAKNNVILNDILNFVLKKFRSQKKLFDEVWLILPTSVLLTYKDYKKASNEFSKKNYSNMIAVSKFPAPIEWAFQIKNDKLYPNNKKSIYLPSQSFKDCYYDTGTFLVYNLKKMNLKNKDIKKNIIFSPYILPPFKGVDIDTIEDWNLAIEYFKIKK